MPTLKIECPACKGTGLYAGFAEPPETAVICYQCDGQGWATITYTEFTGRKKKHGIHHVARSRGMSLLTGVGPTDNARMTYSEFEKQVPVRES